MCYWDCLDEKERYLEELYLINELEFIYEAEKEEKQLKYLEEKENKNE